MMPIIPRNQYLRRLIAFKDKRIIKVITGIRRCGKSTLLEIFQSYLLDHGTAPDQIIAINFEDLDFDELRDITVLHKFIKKELKPGVRSYIFLDEIQQVDDFQRVVDSLYLNKNVDVYITGSNAKILSGEIASLLSGRYVEIEMLPLSFSEYVDFSGNRKELPRKYQRYIEFSSFPYALELDGDRKLVREYLRGIYSTVILKDVVARNRISDVMMLESILRFMFHNIGNIVSIKKISDTMTSGGRKISTHTVESYLSALMDSFILYQVKRFDIKGKQYLKSLEKYYIVDIGLRYFLLGGKSADTGHILENVIYLELRRRGYDIYIGKLDKMEVDFTAMDDSGIKYFQVAATVREQHTLERELEPFKRIRDDYPKILLTLDEDPEADYNGIIRKNALDFLMENETTL